MIQIYQNILSASEITEMISFYENNNEMVNSNLNDGIYHFNSISLIDFIDKFESISNLIKKDSIDRLRIQHIDSSIPMVERPHKHITPFSFVLFLNDNFEGGEIVFDNITIMPKPNQLIYFTGEELHYVKPVTKGDRYTLVGFLNSKLKIDKINFI